MPRWPAVQVGVQERIARDAPGGCWLWTGGKNVYGYGRYNNDEAHRVVYRMLVGPIPPGLHLDHLCRVKACVNPDHLEPVTPGENARRRSAAKNNCVHGHPLDGIKKAKNTSTGTTRYCKTCHRAQVADRTKRLKENANG